VFERETVTHSTYLQRRESSGSGRRTLCALFDNDQYEEELREYFQGLESEMRVLKFFFDGVHYSNLSLLFEELIDALQEENVRQAEFLCFGATSLLLWKLAIAQQKTIRSLLVVNGETRPSYTQRESFVQWCEKRLPLGLPFRTSSETFHASPFLQRFRFPVLVTTTPNASERIINEAHVLERELPVSWYQPLTNTIPLHEEMLQLTQLLRTVPPKCPQKNRKRAVG
jgi:hypothetical protein